MNDSPSQPQTETSPEDPIVSSEGRERLFQHIQRCNGNGVTIQEFLDRVNDPEDSIQFPHLNDLQKAKRIQTQVVRGDVVWVISGENNSCQPI